MNSIFCACQPFECGDTFELVKWNSFVKWNSAIWDFNFKWISLRGNHFSQMKLALAVQTKTMDFLAFVLLLRLIRERSGKKIGIVVNSSQSLDPRSPPYISRRHQIARQSCELARRPPLLILVQGGLYR